MTAPVLSVSDFVAVTNQSLEAIYPSVEVEGEVASFKVNQRKFVFFDIKDAQATVGCFMMVYQLTMPIQDGMCVRVRARPKLTAWGKFSLTVQSVTPVGEGALKKSFELLRAKLEKEGLFLPERKRPLPEHITHIGVVSSTQAAGYADFIKIITDRWSGTRVDVAHVTVQGETAAGQVARAIGYFGQASVPPQVIVVIRGGGSADDLAAFNDEALVRAIAASRIPVVTGIGHEVDESLADLAADVRAATPSNAAQLVTPDAAQVMQLISRDVGRCYDRTMSEVAHIRRTTQQYMRTIGQRTQQGIRAERRDVQAALSTMIAKMEGSVADCRNELGRNRQLLEAYNPHTVLERGYAIVRGTLRAGEYVILDTATQIAKVEVHDVKKRQNSDA